MGAQMYGELSLCLDPAGGVEGIGVKGFTLPFWGPAAKEIGAAVDADAAPAG